MIKVQSLEIVEFRGIRKLTLDFKGKNFAICGPNGTGKSGIVDALEFALTGNISRLSGAGTGDVSVKDHAPHVDSRKHPEKSYVKITVAIPHLKKTATIERSVKTPTTPKITPGDADVAAVLKEVAQHPEFVLSRRELIDYVIATPGDRAKEVQSLLRLDRVEDLRATFQKICNACKRDVEPSKRAADQTRERLLQALEIPQLTNDALLTAANPRRALLGLAAIPALTATTSLRDGLATAAGAGAAQRVPKVQALADLKKLRETLSQLSGVESKRICAEAETRLTAIKDDPAVSKNVTRESLLKNAVSLFDGEQCPVCDTKWEPEKFKAVVAAKQAHFDKITKERAALELLLSPLVDLLSELSDLIPRIVKYGTLLNPAVNAPQLTTLKTTVDAQRKAIGEFLPLAVDPSLLSKICQDVPAALSGEIQSIETPVAAIPEPTQQDAARDYLTVADERLDTYRKARLQSARAEERAKVSQTIFDVYARVSTEALNKIYEKVEKDFADLYRFINRDDEAAFTAKLAPSIGKLGFNVNFYGRGDFPPGAYHSEGHQDGMGLCLYLALMKYLLGDSFTFAVFDDVLMSVDVGHRREVCALLKEIFPNTQFILTTHDPVWLRHMKTAGLVTSFKQFKNWHVDHGPTEWNDRDVWQDIENELKGNNVQAAASLLRNYLEFLGGEVCHRLRARVEFRGDGQFQLGDLLPAATSQLRTLLREGHLAAVSWGKAAEAEAIKKREDAFGDLVAKSGAEQWQINPAIHYNAWANLAKQDFAPVVAMFKALSESFFCTTADCGLLYVIPERSSKEALTCACKGTAINLKRK